MITLKNAQVRRSAAQRSTDSMTFTQTQQKATARFYRGKLILNTPSATSPAFFPTTRDAEEEPTLQQNTIIAVSTDPIIRQRSATSRAFIPPAIDIEPESVPQRDGVRLAYYEEDLMSQIQHELQQMRTVSTRQTDALAAVSAKAPRSSSRSTLHRLLHHARVFLLSIFYQQKNYRY